MTDKKKTPKKIRRFTADIKISGGRLAYDNFRKFKADFRQFKKDNESDWIVVTYEAIDRVQHYQFKYYRGFILDVLAQSKDFKDHHSLHLKLKHDFCFKECRDTSAIPDRFLSRGIIIIEEAHLYTTVIPSGRTIIITRDNVVVGYIPSNAVLTGDEMKEFIKYGEGIRDGVIDFHPTEEMLHYRQIAVGDVEEQQKMFKEE